MTSSKVVLIDGDSIAYRSGYADSVIEMQTAVNNQMGKILEDCATNRYELYLEAWDGTKDIFRNKIAKTKPYKGNRGGRELPPLLNEAREYMWRTYNAKLTREFESEDMVVIRAYEIGIDKCIVACIDKDLMCHPFHFYNYIKGTFETVTKEEAVLNLYRQVLTGDSTDNIPGIYGIGKTKANKLITDPNIALDQCISTYIQAGHGYEYFIEQYNLIWIRSIRSTGIVFPISREEYLYRIQQIEGNNYEQP